MPLTPSSLLSTAERDRRWSQARKLMREMNVEVLIACSDGGDHIPAHQRYLSGYRSLFGYAVFMLFRESGAELIVDYPATLGYAKQLSWVDEPISTAASPFEPVDPARGTPTVAGELVKLIKRYGVNRVGVADLEHFPSQWKDVIASNVAGATFIELGPQIYAMRRTKSAEELAFVREGSRLCDVVCARIPELMKVGRREEEVVADIEHIIRSQGGEQSFNLVLRMPMFEDPVERLPWEGSARQLRNGDLYTVEISPRIRGYYSQLTALVSLGPVDPATRSAYDALIRGRQAGVAAMKAGVDVLDVANAIFGQFNQDGYKESTPWIGHLCGLELDDGLLGEHSMTLEAGMAIIIHPWVTGFPALMHADTFAITKDGAERLTHNPFKVIELNV